MKILLSTQTKEIVVPEVALKNTWFQNEDVIKKFKN